ncbi:ferritin-like domain-containing protein [Salmonella enterica subsp. enterica]|nr:ferritin-like domain-containing protein [Salmonella enterica subsp. enterica serovar Bareilly]EBS6930349.1 ferritin-like domain-containing protein [Salmonella enterica]EBW1879982.1 ferritin-like domain-containing protein [Salmonella enterica subsp. enterica serovar Java]EDR2655734.1 ferritin-like domain-containing protein [Salmonella enterica subsp. enterica]EGI6186599.1 ferritin-like domain-containing protein [Salmonella enterica subsp. enterica serovar Chingola]
MNNQPKMSEINFLEDKHYALYQKGKTKQTWDIGLDWGKAGNDDFPNDLKEDAVTVTSLSSHVELIGMEHAAELMLQATDFSLKIGLAQAVNDEARHAELFSRYAILANGHILDLSKTRELYLDHFQKLNTFDETFLSHVFLENGALEQFNLFIHAFGENSLIGKIYKGAMNDEARHVQLGINYFRQLIKTKPAKKEMVYDHLTTFKKILHVNPDGIAWLSKISRIPGDIIENRVQARHDKFINKIMEGK